MEKKAKFKKIIAMLCVFVILQSYFSCFTQIVLAISEEMDVDDFISASKDENTLSPDDKDSQEPIENIGNEVNPEPEEEPSIGGDETENTTSEDVVPGDETSDEPVEEEPADGETPTEEPEENPGEEETPSEEPNEEPVEPYVEPEVTMEVTSENTSIYKGYLYANATSELKYATNYNTIDVVNIVGGKNMSSLTVQDEPDKMLLITNTKIGLLNQMYYRQSRISVTEFNNILGVDGSITLYTPEGEVVGVVNKESEVVNDEYVFTYPMQLNSVKFEFTNIIADGTISIKNDKSIKESSEFSRNQISLFSSINTIATANVSKPEVEEIKTVSAEGNINLEETESRMLLDVDTDTLSVENNNEVAINITLKTDEERYDLFENPTVDLEFPSAVENVEITGVTLLYKNGLSIDNYEVVTNAVGRKVLKVSLSGAQLEYTPGAVQEGTTIVIYTNINVNRLTADTSEALKMTYTNKDTVRKTYSLEGKDSEDVSLNFVGRQELVRLMQINAGESGTVTGYDEETEKIQIKANEEQTIVISGAVVNNYETTLNDVVIVGRIPFVGNKDGNGNDLGTNFDATLQSAMVTSGVIADVYYSEDGQAEASSDSWTQDLENLSNYKSYKIVVREKTLAKGEKLAFEYHLTIPATVGYNAKGYSNYVTYYKIDTQSYFNQCAIGIFTEEKEIDMDDIKEEDKEEVAVLTIGTQVSQGGRILGETDSVYERQILKYTVVVRNTSNIAANNVVIRANAENANLYSWEYTTLQDYPEVGHEYTVREKKEFTNEEKEYEEFTIESLQSGEIKTFEYEVIVKDLKEIELPEVYGKLKVTIDGTSEVETKTFKNNILDAEVETKIAMAVTEGVDDDKIFTDCNMQMKSIVKNLTSKDLKNVEVVLKVPKSLSFNDLFVKVDDDVKYIKENNGENEIIKFSIPTLEANEEKNIYFTIVTNNMDINIMERKAEVTSWVNVNENTYYANNFEKTVVQKETAIDYKWYSDNTNEKVFNGDNITFYLEVSNIGFVKSGTITSKFKVPDGLEMIGSQVYYNDELGEVTKVETDEVYNSCTLDTGSKMKLVINTKVNSDLYERDQSAIEAGIDLQYKLNPCEVNIISFKIENSNVTVKEEEKEEEKEEDKDNSNNNEDNTENGTGDTDNTGNNNDGNSNNDNTNPEEPDVKPEEPVQPTKKTYYISGTAWIDKNQDGIRQSDEKLKEAVIASLYKANSNGGLDTSNVVATTATTSDGHYTFSSVEPGNYIIVFDYNSSKYKVTKYKVDTATSTEDSDVISKKLHINNESQMFGVTDVLEVSTSSLIAIDIGLVDTTNIDFSIEKEVSKIKVKNNEGTKEYNYNTPNARLDIRSKYYKSSVLDITYNFKVKNEGEVAGYVNKVVDYLPEGVAINLNASPDWYIGSDNGLYYTGLVDKEIAPGETKEFTLVIRKSLEEGEAIKLVNGAEIVESTNALGLFDKDSIENNKMKSEDDYGESTLTVSIATGNAVSYITTTLIIIIMCAVIIMMIIKFKNTKKIYR